MKYCGLVTACLLALCGSVFGQDERFTLSVVVTGVEDGGTVTGSAGSVISVDYEVQFTATVDGVAGVVAPLAGDGASISFDPPACDPDEPGTGDPAACANGEFFESPAGQIFFYVADDVDPDLAPDGGPLAGSPQGPGVIAAVTTNPITRFTYDAGTFPVLRGSFDVTVPTAPEGETVSLTFTDGLQGAGTPQNATITFESASFRPVRTSFSFTVQPTVGGIIPGDTDESGDLSVMDVIEYLDHYFLGDPAQLPCGDGTIFDAGNLALLDSNGDGELDIADAVHQLRAQFLSGPPHASGEDCTTIPGCPAVCDV